ncbi:hypothetical protein KR054_008249 [Drosophila jambulina]|nr:hypothetical protein KR054_008249 [Drosophila jambulina]
MNGSVNQQQLRGQRPLQVPQNGPVMYGSGIVFGGNVYPVLIDGVPIQPPAGAHQAAEQQRRQMQPAGDHQSVAQQQRMQVQQGPHLQQSFSKPLPNQRSYRSDPPAVTAFNGKQTQPQNHQALGGVPGAAAAAPSMTLQQPLYSNQQSQLQQHLRQQQPLPAMGGSYGSCNFNYNQPPRAGGDCFGEWGGYAVWQPTPLEMSKPFTIGWSSF